MLQIVRKYNTVFAIYFVACFVILFIISIFIYSSRMQALAELENTIKNYANISMGTISSNLAIIDSSLLSLGSELSEEKNYNSFARKNINHFTYSLKKFPGVDLIVIDKNDIVVAGSYVGSENSVVGINLGDRDYISVIKKGGNQDAYLSEPIVSRKTKSWITILGRKVMSAKGEYKGIVVAIIKDSFYQQFKDSLQLESKDLFLLTSGVTPRMIFRFPLNDEAIGTVHPYTKNADPVIHGNKKAVFYNFHSRVDNVHRYAVQSRIDHYNLFLTLGLDDERYLHSWRKQSYTVLTMTFLLFLISFAYLCYFLYSLNRDNNQQAVLANSARLVALGEMAGAVGHEINNPLAVIMGQTYKLKKQVKENRLTTDDLSQCVSKIEVMVNRITKIVSGLRKFSRQDKNELKVEKLKMIVTDAMEISKERFYNSTIDLAIDEIPESIFVKVDEVQLLQVLVNLLNNSFDAILPLPERWLKLKLQVEETKIKISIIDSGKGIAPEVAKKMMEPFFTTKGVGKGTGLGLSISKGIIEAFGGSLMYDSSNPNTCFHIILPRAKEIPSEQMAA